MAEDMKTERSKVFVADLKSVMIAVSNYKNGKKCRKMVKVKDRTKILATARRDV